MDFERKGSSKPRLVFPNMSGTRRSQRIAAKSPFICTINSVAQTNAEDDVQALKKQIRSLKQNVIARGISGNKLNRELDILHTHEAFKTTRIAELNYQLMKNDSIVRALVSNIERLRQNPPEQPIFCTLNKQQLQGIPRLETIRLTHSNPHLIFDPSLQSDTLYLALTPSCATDSAEEMVSNAEKMKKLAMGPLMQTSSGPHPVMITPANGVSIANNGESSTRDVNKIYNSQVVHIIFKGERELP